jgi:hypothetical protein
MQENNALRCIGSARAQQTITDMQQLPDKHMLHKAACGAATGTTDGAAKNEVPKCGFDPAS